MPSLNQPINTSGLTALAMQLAADYFGQNTGTVLDEVFPGTFSWVPDGRHDLIWSFSERSKQGSLRVMKTQWNQSYKEFQHSAVPLSGFTNVPKGVGGPSVAQSWVDSQVNITPTQISTPGTNPPPLPPNISVPLSRTMGPTDPTAFVSKINYLPTQNRWKGIISGSFGSETIMFEGTSGGISRGMGATDFAIDVVNRGYDGTIPVTHNNTDLLAQVCPNTTFGVNLVRHEKMQFIYPNEQTSGGIQGCNVVPQVQTLYLFDGSGAIYNGTRYFSGVIGTYDPTQQVPWTDAELIYATERNSGLRAFSGYQYGGQLVGYSPSTNSGVVAPIYAIDDLPYLASGDVTTSKCCNGTITFVPNPSLGTCVTGPTSIFSPGVFSNTPGIWTTVSQAINPTDGCCYTQIIACVQFPLPQTTGQNCCRFSLGPGGTFLSNGPCPPGSVPVDISQCTKPQPAPTSTIFGDSCSIIWSQQIIGNAFVNTPYWNGMGVTGGISQIGTHVDCTNTCDAGFGTIPVSRFCNVDSIFFNLCDFTIIPQSQPCCTDNPNPTQQLGVNTVGLTKDITVLDSNCNAITLCFLRGLLKACVGC